jgi:hypothetical protein
MADAIRVNGNQYEFGSLIAKINGEPFAGLTGLKYSQKRERVKAYGTGRHRTPRGRTAGKYSAEASVTLWKSSAQELYRMLAALSQDGTSYGNIEFQIVAQYIESDETPITVELFRCVIAGEDADDQESADPLKEEIALDVMYIKKNGLTLYDNSEGTT